MTMISQPVRPLVVDRKGSLAKTLLSHLQRSEIFRSYQHAFETVTGLPLVIRGIGSFHPPLQGSKRRAVFCGMMASSNKTCAACLQLQQRVEEESKGTTMTLECFAGLSESLVPITAGKTVFAFLQTGQVFLRPPSKSRFNRLARELAGWGHPLDVVELEKAYFAGRVITPASYDSILRLMTSFAAHLSNISDQLAAKESSAESPTMTRARAFIAEHQADEMSIVQVARAVNMSPWYFCKQFRASTGLSFTNYVARARVESVKHLLRNPEKRVSEAAFESGFQSLSQFNRVFIRVTGGSPTRFRGQNTELENHELALQSVVGNA